MTITLSKAETTILTEAAARPDGLIAISTATKPATRERLLGRFLRDGLASRTEGDEVAHHLTPAGYRAVGLRPPGKAKAAGAEQGSPRPGSKGALILELLARSDGASLAELVAATGWLPHTARAALSRLRSAGQALTRTPRPDGVSAYRIVADEPKPARRKRRAAPEAAPEQGAAEAVAA